MRIFFSAGEPSGDQHAAHLMQALRRRCPVAQFTGFGGPHMQQAGLECLYPLTELAVMGIARVLPLLGKFYRLYQAAKEELRKNRPDAVVLIDFPGFNWWIASAAKAQGIPVFYYCAPQLWAWGGWRITKVRKFVDCILSVLPFEAEWYRSRGVDVEYVGHPFFDEVAEHPLDSATLDRLRSASPRRVAILPGSRKQEVEKNFPVMLKIIERLHAQHPDVRFPVACYKDWHFQRCRALASTAPHLPIDYYTGRTPEVLAAADCCLMVSGSVSLEVLARKVPAVVMYRGSVLMWALGRTLVTCKYISLPNLLANRELMPEFPFTRRLDLHAERMAARLNEWLSQPLQLATAKAEMSQLADSIVEAGGVSQAASVLLRRLGYEQAVQRAA